MASKNPFLSGSTPAKPQGAPVAKRPGHLRSSSSSADLLFARPEDAPSPSPSPGGGDPGLSLSDWISMADTLRTQVEQVSAQPTDSQRSSIVSLDSDAELDSFRGGGQSDESSKPAPLAPPTGPPPVVDRCTKPAALTLRKGHGRSRSMGDPLATIALGLPGLPELPDLDTRSGTAARNQFSKARSATLSATFPISEETPQATIAATAVAVASAPPPSTAAAPAAIDVQAEVDALVARNAALKQVNSQMQHELSRVKADRLFLEQKLSLVITAAQQ